MNNQNSFGRNTKTIKVLGLPFKIGPRTTIQGIENSFNYSTIDIGLTRKQYNPCFIFTYLSLFFLILTNLVVKTRCKIVDYVRST